MVPFVGTEGSVSKQVQGVPPNIKRGDGGRPDPARTLPTLVVSTCGTSLITSGVDRTLSILLRDTTNLDEEAIADHPQLAELDCRINEVRSLAASLSIAEACSRSAELNGILGLYRGDPGRGKADHHVLLTTDTFQGRASGEAVVMWLQAHGLSAEIHPLQGFRTDDLASFRSGINRLVDWCSSVIPGYRERGYKVIFNLVGSFKALQAYASTLAALYADEQLYVFEAPNSPLLRIPRLPVRLDAAGIVSQHLPLFRRLVSMGALPHDEVAALPETLLEIVGDEAELSPWGRVIFNEGHSELYRQVLPPPTERVHFHEDFMRDLHRQDPLRRIALQERIDQLARYQHTNGRENPNSLDVHAIKGGPVNGATYQCDAWTGERRRLHLRLDDQRVTILRIAEHM